MTEKTSDKIKTQDPFKETATRVLSDFQRSGALSAPEINH